MQVSSIACADAVACICCAWCMTRGAPPPGVLTPTVAAAGAANLSRSDSSYCSSAIGLLALQYSSQVCALLAQHAVRCAKLRGSHISMGALV